MSAATNTEPDPSPDAPHETTPDETTPDRTVDGPDARLGDVGRHVSRHATRLLKSRDSSVTVATLARLRANVGREPGTDPTIWGVTVDGVPGDAHGDDPSPQERAVHAALTLFALHQQSRTEPMHRPGVGFGRAVGYLDYKRPGSGEGPGPVRRRFNAALTSTGSDELAEHLRGLVAQLRAEGIGLDYGLLADDLLQFQRVGGADTVRRRWGRQFHGNHTATAAEEARTSQDETPTSQTTTTEEHE